MNNTTNKQSAPAYTAAWLAQLGVIWLSLSAANFFYQALTAHNYGDAAERSVFQLIAIAAVAITRPYRSV